MALGSKDSYVMAFVKDPKLNYGNYGRFLIMGHAGSISSTV